MKREPIRKKRLSDEVRERLLEEIQEGHLAPGATLPSERELMDAYGVGRPAIREAMQSLQGLGLIHVRHGERPRVAEPQLDLLAEQLALTMRHVLTYDPDILNQLKEARAVLEVEMAKIAARNRSKEDIAELREILKRQDEASGTTIEFMKTDGAFHGKLSEISGNFLLASVVKAIFAWLERFHLASVRQSGLEKLTLQEHEAILEAIVAGDAEAAGEAMRLHLTRANELYRRTTGNSPA
jgi:GntR family transcriptional regulator, sialic acid-inducible nan operon repressor